MHFLSPKKKYLQTLLYCSVLLSSASLSAVAFTVNSLADTNTGVGTTGTLRFCINQANVAGGVNSIAFSVNGTVNLTQSLPPIGGTLLTLTGNPNTINGQNLHEALFVNPGTNVNIALLNIQNTVSQGGNGGNGGSNGGGGALGAGGGIFVSPGSGALISAITFSNCAAKGGNGGDSTTALASGGGGGGGMNEGNGGIASTGGGGGGGYGGVGGTALGIGGGGGGGQLFNGGNGDLGGGGGGSDANPGQNSPGTGNGGDGGADLAANAGGTGGASGAAGGAGGNGVGNSGGGGGGHATGLNMAGGNGGNSNRGAGGGGGSDLGAGGNGNDSVDSYGGGGGGGHSVATGGGSGGSGGDFGGGGGGGGATGVALIGGLGGNGGYGGAGAGGGDPTNPGAGAGNGGFGAGGGGGYSAGTSGQGGFGGGNGGGSGRKGGGGGAGFGGAFFIGNNGSMTVGDPISISGSSVQAGAGGPSGGGAGMALGTDIFIETTGQLSFDFLSTATTLTIATSIQSDTVTGGGTGGLAMAGAGKLILTASNNYAGRTTVGGTGTISISNDNNLGAINNIVLFNGGILEMTAGVVSARQFQLGGAGTVQTDSGSSFINGQITNSGPFNKSGPANLFLTAANTYTDATNVQAGLFVLTSTGSIASAMPLTILSGATAQIDGTVASPVNVNAGGTLKGVGTINNTTTINGNIMPGDSIGTINGATFIFNAGSTYFLEFNNTMTDLIAATTNVTINPGSTLSLVPVGLTSPQSVYTIITAPTVVVNGPFTLVNPLTRYNFGVIYNPTNVLLVLLSSPIPFNDIIGSGVGRCFDVLLNENLPDLMPILQILDQQTFSQIQDSLNQMRPTNFNNIAFAEENVAELIRQTFTRHFYEQRAVSCPEQEPWRIWLAPFYETARQHGDHSHPGYSERFSGFTTAADYRMEKHWIFSTGFSYAASEMNVLHSRTHAHFRSYAGTIGTAWTDTAWFADALFSYLFSPVHGSRKMVFSVTSATMRDKVTRKATHHESDNQILSHLGGGYNFKIRASYQNTYNIYPFANLDYYYMRESDYREHGAQSLDLKVKSKSYDLLRSEGGFGVNYKGCFTQREVLCDVSVSYVGEFRFQGKRTYARFVPANCTFSSTGLKPQNNLICPTARVRIAAPNNGFSLTLGYHGEFGAHFHLNAGEAELRKSF